jgi:hypothetical protein
MEYCAVMMWSPAFKRGILVQFGGTLLKAMRSIDPADVRRLSDPKNNVTDISNQIEPPFLKRITGIKRSVPYSDFFKQRQTGAYYQDLSVEEALAVEELEGLNRNYLHTALKSLLGETGPVEEGEPEKVNSQVYKDMIDAKLNAAKQERLRKIEEEKQKAIREKEAFYGASDVGMF